MISEQDLQSHYRRYFYTLKASTSDLKETAYKIRYQVYFQEQKMISAEHVGESFETDRWDSDAVHSILFHKPTNQPIGNVRVIPLENTSHNILPIEQHYKKSFDFSATQISQLRDGKIGEVSRMAILSSFRRRPMDRDYSLVANQDKGFKAGRRFPVNYMPMCLAFAAINLLMEQRLDYGVALMEPRLAKLLERFGVALKQVGQPIDYFGLRAPYLIFPEKTYQNLLDDYRGLFDIIRGELSGS
ncbi:MAG: PEP-CTERM/exosortase system-associated acyltransferase [Gammaproteobacteria bacterium]